MKTVDEIQKSLDSLYQDAYWYASDLPGTGVGLSGTLAAKAAVREYKRDVQELIDYIKGLIKANEELNKDLMVICKKDELGIYVPVTKNDLEGEGRIEITDVEKNR